MEANEVTVVARIAARPEAVEAMRVVLTALVAPTRGERGCLAYAFYQADDDPASFISVERWTDRAAAAAHMETPHVRAALAAAGPLFAAPPQIRSYRTL